MSTIRRIRGLMRDCHDEFLGTYERVVAIPGTTLVLAQMDRHRDGPEVWEADALVGYLNAVLAEVPAWRAAGRTGRFPWPKRTPLVANWRPVPLSEPGN